MAVRTRIDIILSRWPPDGFIIDLPATTGNDGLTDRGDAKAGLLRRDAYASTGRILLLSKVIMSFRI